MKFLHVADLHLGKSIYGTSLIDNGDQKFWLERFLEKADELKPDAVVIAGDVYDKSQPSGKAVQLLSNFITELSNMNITVLMTAGNHDSVQVLSFLSPLLENQQVYISKPLNYQQDSQKNIELTHATLKDEHGQVTFWLMPYVYPAIIAQAMSKLDSQAAEIKDYDTAISKLLKAQPVDFTQRNVLIAHQNVTAGGHEVERGGSETMVGGVGQVDYRVFDGFDYVALGHIHSGYSVGRPSIRYAGTPMAYHFDETRQPDKGALLVTLFEKNKEILIEKQSIEPLHRMRIIKGKYEDIQLEAITNPWVNEYLKIILTDVRISPEISDFFHEAARTSNSTVMELTSEFRNFMGNAAFKGTKDIQEKTVEELFADFYTDRNNGVEPDEKDWALMKFVGELTSRRPTAGSSMTESTESPEPAGAPLANDNDFHEILKFILEQEKTN